MKRTSAIGSVLLALSLSLLAPSVALAQESDPYPTPPPGSGESTSMVAPEVEVTNERAVVAGFAPNCNGFIDDVHKSGGMASVHGRTVCKTSGRNFISLSIGYIGWAGERYAVSGGSATALGGKTANGFAKSVCSGKGNQTWRAFGYHSATIRGTVYYGNTMKDDAFWC
ncbi:MAG: hypothetical protein ACTIA6_09160 [Pseudoclavibacter sp.]